MALKTDVKFEGKPTYAFKYAMRDLANFYKLKNSNFILESNMAKLDKNKTPKQPDRPDAV